MTREAASVHAVAASDLTIEYPPHGASPAYVAVHGLSLRIEPGEVVGLLGESGSGKSTIAQVLSGRAFTRPTGSTEVRPVITGGEVRVLGMPLGRMRRRSLARLTFDVGFLAQDAADRLPAALTVAEIVAAPVLERDPRFNRAELGTRVATIVDAVRLPLAVLKKYPYELSGGQRQRVALARALVFAPTLLIADEPTAGVDLTLRDALIDLVSELQRERAFSALVVSHDLHVLRGLTNRIGVMHQGVLVALGTIDEVFTDPWHPYVAKLAEALAPPRDEPDDEEPDEEPDDEAPDEEAPDDEDGLEDEEPGDEQPGAEPAEQAR
ncbi:ATP-binding cassette domain-containing protein [Cryobacterium tepidiphilum]|uniref:ABC transporter ATP-binding protein n=1 Tax=Cryobacterium tepidiphilum TaxID=2486026 RepID=A0A3M8KZ47_9MICO|nr:dipeptide/oligopeptide/nickel ABC transporter ATP-binding protein [Cryobacterium tepidiphilum]RNE58553.1 ABC transporter ATP-binding protein [Cryobacterium tepidiphilum]